jgi:hypothetical protein
VKTRQVAPHVANCIAVEQVATGRWNSPWFLNGEAVYADKRGGGRGSSYRWLVATCNTVSSHPCPARILIREDSILDEIPTGEQAAAERQQGRAL